MSYKDKTFELTFKQIAMEQLQRITILMSKEMRGGYHNSIMKKVGDQTVNERVYIPDTRQDLMGAIKALYYLCYPRIDKVAKEDIPKRMAKIKALDPSIDGYISKKLILYKDLYLELSLLIKRRNYFGIKEETF